MLLLLILNNIINIYQIINTYPACLKLEIKTRSYSIQCFYAKEPSSNVASDITQI